MSTQVSKFPCPHCTESFNSKFELDMHTWKKHAAINKPAAPINTTTVKTLTPPPTQRKPEREVKPQQTQQEELIIEYNLAESKQGLGELCPVLKDKNGNIIDGFHRKGENQNWREETLPWIDTPVKLELARLAVNFNRRKVTPHELSERITFLIKAGVSVEEIAKATGISERTIYRYKPANLKNPVKVTNKSTKVDNLSTKFDDTCQQTVTTSDSNKTASRLPTPESLPKSTPTKKQPTPEEAAKLAEGYRESAEEDLKIAEEMTGKDYANTPTLNDEETPQPKTTETWVSVTVECYNYKKHAIVQTRSVEVGDDRFCASDCEANACPLNRSKERKLNNSSAAPLTSN